MGNGVNPGEEYDRPSSKLMERDVFVKRNDVIERRSPEHRDEVPADWEQQERNIDVEHESRGASNWECNAEYCTGSNRPVLEPLVSGS